MIRIFIAVLILFSFKTEAQSSVLNVSDSLMANGNFSKAISNYKKAVAANTENTLIQYEFGKLLSKTKKNEEAVSVFNKLKAIDNTNPNYHYELGVVLERLKQKEAAENSYKKAYKLDSKHQKAIFKLAKQSLKEKEFERLGTLVTIGLNSYAKNAALISLKAQSMYAQRKYTKAIVWFEKLLELGEKSQFIYEKLSFAYKKEIEYEKAIEYLKKALLYEPKNTGNLYRLGSLYDLINDYENAEKNIKLSLELQDEPLDREYSKLATIYNRLKQPQEAVKYFNKALKENPNNEQAKFFLVVTKSSYYKDLQSRIDLFENFIKNNPESNYITFAKIKLSELRTEQFMKIEDNKN